MGQIIIEGDSVIEYLIELLRTNISKLSFPKVQYSCILNDQGFVLDDFHYPFCHYFGCSHFI